MEKICKNCKFWNQDRASYETRFGSSYGERMLIRLCSENPEYGLCDYADFLCFTKESYTCEAWEAKVDTD